MIRKLVDAIVHGFGASAGADLYAEVKKSPESTRADTPDAKRAAALRREAEAHERAARKARKALDAAVDAELRAMKKRIARDG